MKIQILLILFLQCAISAFAEGIVYNKTVDEIWGARVFMELNGKYAGVSRNDEAITWPSNDKTVMVYCLRVPKSHVRADVVFTPRSGKTVTFNLRVVQASNGNVITENTCTVNCKSSAETIAELMPDIAFPSDTWYRFEITSPKGNTTMSKFTKLRFQRKSTLAVGDSPIYMSPSVHLFRYGSTATNAPSGESYDWIYQEGMIPPEYECPSTYAMVIGTDEGYSGFQSIYKSNGTYERPILFSVWDNGDLDNDPAMPEYLKSGVVDKGENVMGVRFGGEGTGASARLVEGSWWTPGKWVQFLWNARPEQVQVTLKAKDGRDSVVSYQNTLQSCWYKMEDDPQWHYIATLRESGRNHYYKGFYAFLENFYDVGGELVHRAYYRNAAMRSVASGKWYARNSVDFGHTQNDGTRFSRKDYGHGVTKLYENCFYLQTGGFGNICDSAKVLPLPQNMPWVDTINIKALTARVDEAIRRDEASQAIARVDALRKINMSTWKLIKYSDEELSVEGNYGRAAQALDGLSSSYWHSQWKPTKTSFPHYLILDAGKETTINGISLYQSRESAYRARTYRLFTSEDGKTWKSRKSGTFANENSPEVNFDMNITSRYFKIDFLSSYGGEVLCINEIVFTCPYVLESVLDAANKVIQNAGRLGGYKKDDIKELKNVYDLGNCTDIDALLGALNGLANVMPLKYSEVNKLQNISSSRCYQIHNASKGSVLYGQKESMQTLCINDGEEDALDSCANWLILRSEIYNQYYIYNLGAELYLVIQDNKLTLSDKPQAIRITAVNGGFKIGNSTLVYNFFDNYTMAPNMDAAYNLLLKSEIILHPELETSISKYHECDTIEAIYDLQGRLVSKPNGLNIIQYSDGTIKKILTK
jgi:hypothetical protein